MLYRWMVIGREGENCALALETSREQEDTKG